MKRTQLRTKVERVLKRIDNEQRWERETYKTPTRESCSRIAAYDWCAKMLRRALK